MKAGDRNLVRSRRCWKRGRPNGPGGQATREVVALETHELEKDIQQITNGIAAEGEAVGLRNRGSKPQELDDSHTPAANQTSMPARLHPLLAKTRAGFKKARPDMWGRLVPEGLECLDIRVGTSNVGRALAIMDTFVIACQRAGYKLKLVSKFPRRTLVIVKGEELRIRLAEATLRAPHRPTLEERRRIRESPLHEVPKWDYRPTGKLRFTIDEENISGARLKREDSKRHRLETKVQSFVEGLAKAAQGKKVYREEQEKQKQRWEEEQRRAWAEQVRRQEEKERLEDLGRRASNWQRSRLLRDFLAALKDGYLLEHGEIEAGGRFDEWMKWACQSAECLDPIRQTLRELTRLRASPRGAEEDE